MGWIRITRIGLGTVLPVLGCGADVPIYCKTYILVHSCRLGLVLVQYVHVLHVQYIRTSSFLPGVVGTGAVLVYPSSNFLSIHVLVPDRVVLSIVLGRWKVPGTSRQ